MDIRATVLHAWNLSLVVRLMAAILCHVCVATDAVCVETADFRPVRYLTPASQSSSVKNVTVPTHVQCAQLCLFLPTCVSFTFNTSNSLCQMWSDDVTATGITGSSDVRTMSAKRSNIPLTLAEGCRDATCPYGTACFRRGLGGFCLPVSASDVRLVGGSDGSEGRVELLYEGEWGTVCDDGFGSNDAIVVCRMLGLPTGSLTEAKQSAYFGAGSGTILLDDVVCQGTETSIFQCSHRGIRSHNCAHSEDVGVRCQA